MALTWLFTIVVQFGIVLSDVEQCPCTNLNDRYQDIDNNWKASCSCSMCLDGKFDTKSIDDHDPNQVEGWLEAVTRYGDNAVKYLTGQYTKRRPMRALFINGHGRCPSFGGNVVSLQDDSTHSWIKHSGTLQDHWKTIIHWQYQEANGFIDPIPAIAIKAKNGYYNSMARWIGHHIDPCSKGRKGTYAVCTYCFCISFILQICVDTESKYPNIHSFQCIAICVQYAIRFRGALCEVIILNVLLFLLNNQVRYGVEF